MKNIYVTEKCRFLVQAFKGMPSKLDSVRATVSESPIDPMAPERIYKPEEWRALLSQQGVLYRYRKEEYAPVAS